MTINATVVFNGIPALMVQMNARSRENVDDAASDIRDRAAQLAPRDTGSLAESIYVGNGTESDYIVRAGAASSRNPLANIVPEVTPESVISLSGETGYMAVVGVAVEHGLYQEFGTRFQSAQPFLIPSAEAVRDPFQSAMTHVADV